MWLCHILRGCAWLCLPGWQRKAAGHGDAARWEPDSACRCHPDTVRARDSPSCWALLLSSASAAAVRAAGRGYGHIGQSHASCAASICAVRWTDGFWAERFDWCRKVVIPNMGRLLADPNVSHAYENFLIAAGQKQGRHRGPKWNDGDFYKWLEAVAFVYATTHDEALDRQMDASSRSSARPSARMDTSILRSSSPSGSICPRPRSFGSGWTSRPTTWGT